MPNTRCVSSCINYSSVLDMLMCRLDVLKRAFSMDLRSVCTTILGIMIMIILLQILECCLSIMVKIIHCISCDV